MLTICVTEGIKKRQIFLVINASLFWSIPSKVKFKLRNQKQILRKYYASLVETIQRITK